MMIAAMSRMKARLFLLIVSLLFAWLVWPTPWNYAIEYQPSKANIRVPIRVRFNRFSGQKQTFFLDDWHDGSIIVD
jgi:hypothetical protein